MVVDLAVAYDGHVQVVVGVPPLSFRRGASSRAEVVVETVVVASVPGELPNQGEGGDRFPPSAVSGFLCLPGVPGRCVQRVAVHQHPFSPLQHFFLQSDPYPPFADDEGVHLVPVRHLLVWHGVHEVQYLLDSVRPLVVIGMFRQKGLHRIPKRIRIGKYHGSLPHGLHQRPQPPQAGLHSLSRPPLVGPVPASLPDQHGRRQHGRVRAQRIHPLPDVSPVLLAQRRDGLDPGLRPVRRDARHVDQPAEDGMEGGQAGAGGGVRRVRAEAVGVDGPAGPDFGALEALFGVAADPGANDGFVGVDVGPLAV
mmetsp:Transcript_14679/g.32409  ORF Transcript_14679/g.32409 Transcript_14679/m.32409 type:complete len:310 (+) Transcript_14679:276-1205(+)